MKRRALARCSLALLAPAFLNAQAGSVEGTITARGGPVGNVVVYLVPSRHTVVPAPDSLQVDMDQRALHFVPQVLAVTPGSTVAFANSDSVLHNVFHPARPFRGGFDLGTYPPGEERRHTFPNEGSYIILCRIHPEMVGYVVVVASRYRAVSDDSGRFRIDSVVPGAYTLRTWHARLLSDSELVDVPAGGTAHVTLSLEFGHPEEPGAIRRAREPPEPQRRSPTHAMRRATARPANAVRRSGVSA